MINQLLNWQNYFVINVALFISYFLLRFLIRKETLGNYFSQAAQLNFLRQMFISISIIFILMPILVPETHKNIQLFTFVYRHPLKLEAHRLIPITDIQKPNFDLTFKKLIFYFWLFGLVINTIAYLKKCHSLNQLKKKAWLFKKMGSVEIFFTDIQTACCFTLGMIQTIILPQHLYASPKDLKLNITHELQHIRQRDPYWLHFLSIIQIFCFWNPIIKYWQKLSQEIQEYACDEAIALNKKNSLPDYAQCLINAAKLRVAPRERASEMIAMNGESTSIIYRRVKMLFVYKPIKKKFIKSLIYGLHILGVTSSAYAVNQFASPLNQQEVARLLNATFARTMAITPEPEVVDELNRIRANKIARDKMQAGLNRMQKYQPYMKTVVNHHKVPYDLLAMPLVQSGYQPLPAKMNVHSAAGLWQIIPSTAKNLGLLVNQKQDDRLDTVLSTEAAFNYLQSLYNEFNDWKLAVVAYELGENETARLIKATGSRNAWTIARSPYVSKQMTEELTHYLAKFDASVIIIHHPGLVNS